MTSTQTPFQIGTISHGAEGRVINYGRNFAHWGRIEGFSETHVLLEDCDNGSLHWLSNHTNVTSPKRHFTDADAEVFHAAHNWQRGCQMGRTAGSATLECDTHSVCLSLDIPVLLRDI